MTFMSEVLSKFIVTFQGRVVENNESGVATLKILR